METVCPECSTHISATAVRCPQCGFEYEEHQAIAVHKSALPRSEGAGIETLNPFADLVLPGIEQDQRIKRLLNDVDHLARVVPSFINLIGKLGEKNRELVADISARAKAQLAAGEWKLSVDETGQVLASFRDKAGHFAENIRLKEVVNAPDLGPSIVMLQQQVAQAEILNQLASIQSQLEAIQQEIVSDRLGTVDGAAYRLLQAHHTADTRLRELMLLDALGQATTARAQLEHAVKSYKNDVLQRASRKGKESDRRAKDARLLFDSLAMILKSVQLEVIAHRLLENDAAGRVALSQFDQFLQTAGLSNRETLIKLHGYSNGSVRLPIDQIIQFKEASRDYVSMGERVAKGQIANQAGEDPNEQ